MKGEEYFELVDDMLVPQRWVLGDPRGGTDWLDPSQFTGGSTVCVSVPMTFEPLKPGRPLEFSISPAFVPVVTRRAADLLTAVCGPQVQIIPVAVDGHEDPFFIANATRTADCVDEHRSRGIRRWTAEDGQPNKIGNYQGFDQLVIDPSRTGGLDLFRVARYALALIVSDRLKRAMEDAKFLGPKFELVT